MRNTKFTRIFNGGFDKNGDSVDVGGRWHGRARAGRKMDAKWVAPYDADVTAWLGGHGLNWLATTPGMEPKKVNDTHALKAGVNSRGKNATTPEQRLLHSLAELAGGRAHSVG